MSVVKVNNLCMFFGGVKAVENVAMDIKKGEIVGLIGPNGAGKTTVFNVLTGMYKPTHGEVVYNFGSEFSINKMKPSEIVVSGVARTFQNIRLFSDMTVEDNIRVGLQKNIKYSTVSSLFRLPGYFKEETIADKKTTELLDIFKLTSQREELAKNLPYGEQRRLEIARALATGPKVLLLDEPAAGMNPNETIELMKMIKWIRDKFDITIILIEHDMSLVMSVCSRIYVLDYGKLISEGTPEHIKNDPAVIKAYLGGEEEA
ncbi:MAG: ABC transporter ATP-binding protein [Bacillota bacterium]|nr:ABC transporter ATP-binding protein [Bacillota bacterium]